jgi:glutaconate CoA-transferase subunit B
MSVAKPAVGTPTTRFSEREFEICVTARMIEDGRTYWVAIGGGPLYAILLAKKLYAPMAMYTTEDGVIAPEPAMPLDPMVTGVATRPNYRALMWSTMNGLTEHAQLGYMDYGILNSLQVDPYGNINSTWIGAYPDEGRRMNGPGGADAIASLCWRVILMVDQQKRKFIPEVDFISSPGFLDGETEAREKVGLPRGTGPWRVVTPWAVFDYEEKSHHLRLIARGPFVTEEQIREEMDFKPLIADEVEVLDLPTEEELLILRAELDTRGQTTGVGRWVEQKEDGSWHFWEEKGGMAMI